MFYKVGFHDSKCPFLVDVYLWIISAFVSCDKKYTIMWVLSYPQCKGFDRSGQFGGAIAA